jgi:hypothetical protein
MTAFLAAGGDWQSVLRRMRADQRSTFAAAALISIAALVLSSILRTS